MSALITVAMIGYPPVVCRSAISRIGCPAGGNLQRAERRGVGQHLRVAGVSKRGPVQAKPHAIRSGIDDDRAPTAERRARRARSGPTAGRAGSAPWRGTGSGQQKTGPYPFFGPETTRVRPRFSQRQAIAGPQRPALEPAHGARKVRGTTLQDGRHGNPAGNRQIGTGAAATAAETKHRPARTANGAFTGIDRPSTATSKSAPVTAAIRSSSNSTSGPTSVTSSVAASDFVSDQRVGQTMRPRIHRTRDRHAATLPAPATVILNRRQHARCDDTQRRHSTCTLEPGILARIDRVELHGVARFEREPAPGGRDRTA